MAMHIAIVCLLAVAVSVSAEADPQFGYGVPAVYPYDAFYPDQPSYFRAGMPLTSLENQKPENRLFFGTVTFTLATTTSTSIITTSTTCTTSASAISICSPAARRRRDFLLGAKKGRLFYSDDNEEEDSIFYKSPEPEAAPVVAAEPEVDRVARSPAVPFIIQPGFNAPEEIRGGRFLVAFGTSTIISVSTSTYTNILTATCKSTTGYSTCNGNGRK